MISNNDLQSDGTSACTAWIGLKLPGIALHQLGLLAYPVEFHLDAPTVHSVVCESGQATNTLPGKRSSVIPLKLLHCQRLPLVFQIGMIWAGKKGTSLSNNSQDSMQPTGHGRTPSLGQLRTIVANTSCLPTPQSCHSLSDLVKRKCSYFNGWVDIQCLQAIG